MEIIKITCKRCSHTWIPRKENIKQCPKCHSPYWNKERWLKGV
jgi:Zn finger protein HypA/HybF involved in hydrogenase expression